MKSMTVEEFSKKVKESFRKSATAYPKQEVEEYLASQEESIKECYEAETDLIKRGLQSGYSPSGVAYGMMLEF